jgi:positive regulator of sigma E activity
MVTWRIGLAALVVVFVSALMQYLLFASTFTEAIGPAVGAAVGYVLVSVAIRRHRGQASSKRNASGLG